MKETPNYVLRNCTIFVDRESKVGQASEINIPAFKVKTEEFRNAGMVKPRRVNMGYETLEMSVSFTAFDPQVMKLFGLAPGVEKELMVTGALIDEDGTTHSAVCYVRGFLDGVEPGAWAAGEKAQGNHTFSVHYVKLEVDGQPIIEADDFDVKIGGVSQTRGQRNALLLN